MATESAGAVSLDVASLAGLHPALQRHALRRAYTAVAGDPRRLSERHLEAMLSLLHGEAGAGSVHLPRSVRARRQYGELTVATESEQPVVSESPREHVLTLPEAPDEILEAETGRWRLTAQLVPPGKSDPPSLESSVQFTTRLNPEALGRTVTLRTRQPGDRFQPSGMNGTKKLQDYFTDAKIPHEQRDTIPLLVCERGIAWVAGHRTAHWAVANEGEPALWVSLAARNHRIDG